MHNGWGAMVCHWYSVIVLLHSQFSLIESVKVTVMYNEYYVENKALFETWNKVNKNKVLWYCEALRCETKSDKKMFSIMSNLQTHYHFKLDFQKVD